MTLLAFGLLVVAGFFAGLVGFVTGLASLVSYPALLAAGLSPVAANVTNTVALVAAGVGATTNASSEIAKDGRQLIRVGIVSAVGGLVGAIVLLTAPAGSFEAVVPFLVAFAAIALLLQPRLRNFAGTRKFPTLYPVALFFVALALICTSDSIWRASILKSFLLGIANLVAAIFFAFSGDVNWLAALALAIGAFVGGYSGPPVVKVIPPNFLRLAVVFLGLGLAAWLQFA